MSVDEISNHEHETRDGDGRNGIARIPLVWPLHSVINVRLNNSCFGEHETGIHNSRTERMFPQVVKSDKHERRDGNGIE